MTTKEYPPYSVLMSVYHKDNPEWLKQSIESILAQTVQPTEFVIIKDGPVTPEIGKVLNSYKKKQPKLFNVVQLKENIGLGLALKAGIEHCHNEYIARMDADDYAVPKRIEKQLNTFEKYPELDLVGSNVEEFNGTIDNVISHVTLPEKQQQIYSFAKKRCPFRHPSLLYKKSAILKAGNYRSYHLCEDYDLYTRLLQTSCKCYNIQEPLTYMRVDKDFYKRRGGIKYLKSILKFKKEQVATGFFSKKDYIVSAMPHIVTCLMPNSLRDWTYRNLLRKRPHTVNSNRETEIRILHIVPNMQAGGLESLIMNWYREMHKYNIQFDFLVHYQKDSFYDNEIRQLGGKIYRFTLRDDNNLVKYIRLLNKFYREHPEYKVIHCHMNSIGFIHMMIAKKNGVKVRIAHSHNSKTENTLKGTIKAILMRPVRFVSTHNFACSTEAGKYLFKNKSFTIIPNAVNVNRFKFSPDKRKVYRKTNHLDHKTVIGHIGRFDEQKNHKYLLEIFKEVQAINPNSILLLAGTGKLLPEITEYASNLNLTKSIRFLGTIKNTDEFYQGIDVFVLPSLFEGLPVTGIEAQIAGLPCFFSKSITKEVKISNKAVFLPIDTSPRVWSEAIIKSVGSKRTYSISQAYDIIEAAANLANIYTQFYNRAALQRKI